MTNNVHYLRERLAHTLKILLVLHSHMSVEQLIARHRQLILLRDEGYTLLKANLIGMPEIEPITNAMRGFHNHAKQARIPIEIIETFNLEREDWKAIETYRQSLPRHRRLQFLNMCFWQISY